MVALEYFILGKFWPFLWGLIKFNQRLDMWYCVIRGDLGSTGWAHPYYYFEISGSYRKKLNPIVERRDWNCSRIHQKVCIFNPSKRNQKHVFYNHLIEITSGFSSFFPATMPSFDEFNKLAAWLKKLTLEYGESGQVSALP